MRILFISHSSGLDGAEQCLLDLLKYLNRDRYEALVLFPKDGPLRRIVNSIGWETLIFNMPWWIARDRRSRWHFRKVFFEIWPRVMFLRKLMKKKHVDLVYTNTITCIDAAIAAKLEGIPHIWHIHEILRGHTSLKSYLPRFFMSVIVSLLSERVIVPSKAAKKEIEWRRLQRKIQVINNGVDLKRFYSNKSTDFPKDLRDELGIAKDAKVVALIGSFIEIKGQLDFIEAAKKVLNERQECLFLLVGSGNATATESIKKKAKDLGILEKVYLIGCRTDIEQIMNSFDIVVSASWVECFPRVICEAMAAGKPVVATRCGGPEEMVVDGETGFLVPIKAPDKLADAIIKLLLDPDKANMMGQNGRNRANVLFRAERYVENIMKVLDEFC